MRDLIERAGSHYWHDMGTAETEKIMMDAIISDHTLIDFRDYAMQLKQHPHIFRSYISKPIYARIL
jgi:hypothetical protein